MKIVVLGGSGFIGGNLIASIHDLCGDADITVFDRTAAAGYGAVKQVQGEFASGYDFASLIHNADLVIHLISTSVPGNEKGVSQEVHNNVIPSVELFEACAANGVKRVVFLSSGGTVYGVSGQRRNQEGDLPDPINTYGLQKVMIEQALRVICRNSAMEYQVIRLSNPYGPGQNPHGPLGLITKLVYQSLMGEPINIFGDGSVVRDFIFIADAISGIIDVIREGEINTTYNIGRGIGTSVSQVVDTLERVVPETVDVIHHPGRKIDVPYSVLDISKYRQISSLDHFISLDEGILRTYSYFKGH